MQGDGTPHCPRFVPKNAVVQWRRSHALSAERLCSLQQPSRRLQNAAERWIAVLRLQKRQPSAHLRPANCQSLVNYFHSPYNRQRKCERLALQQR